MNQQDLLDILEGRKDYDDVKNFVQTPDDAMNVAMPARPATVTGVEAYTGPWGFEQARHLLARTTFGPTREMIEQVVSMGMDAAVDMLLADNPQPDPPVNYDYENDPYVAIGETWIDKQYTLDPFIKLARTRSLHAWQEGLTLKSEISIREKMTLFWNNHFVVSIESVNDPKFIYRHIATLRENALGNYRELNKLMTTDPATLRYLNGRQNRVGAPNENFARELLELFSIGKGPQVGPGDYTNYTEGDIAAAAKILTGWVDLGYNDILGLDMGSDFRPARHDTTTKTLSHRFNNVEITNAGEDEYANLIDIIFEQDACAEFIIKKLYRFFVYYDINEEEQTNVIDPLVDEMVAFDYDVKETLRILFKSEHFYDSLNCGCIIKSPFEFVNSVFNQFDIYIADDFRFEYGVWNIIYNFISANQQQYFAPPDVAGWKAYYQEPSFNRIWVNSVTLPLRMLLTDVMILVGFNNGNDELVVIDVLPHVASYENASDPNELIQEAINRHLIKDLTDNQKAYLKEQLIPGLPDFEWTVEYQEYLGDPNNEELRASVETKLRLFFRTLLLLPEFHLS